MAKNAPLQIDAMAAAKPVVIALHCSGASGRQWRPLAAAFEGRVDLIAPDFFGCASRGHWHGERAFTLKDEAASILDVIDSVDRPVHLVGHSYGGAVALRVAVERPTRIASLSLYEPTAFHMLKAAGFDGQVHLAEVRGVAHDVQQAVLNGAYQVAARRFVDYWNGDGAWSALRPEHQADLVRYIPKGCLDFRALMEEPMPLPAYKRIRARLLLLRGDHAPGPTVAIVRKLTSFMKPANVVTIAGAGHMGPFSHAEPVARAIAGHIAASEPHVDCAFTPARLRAAA